ncbi:MAG: hypothetical protein AMJ46_07595 [Latescibacteria bacterium DG_63]|nr:MAG: hypothetical protein AMJ46_07595 [Latescibacteria bacterium DG_63]
MGYRDWLRRSSARGGTAHRRYLPSSRADTTPRARNRRHTDRPRSGRRRCRWSSRRSCTRRAAARRTRIPDRADTHPYSSHR